MFTFDVFDKATISLAQCSTGVARYLVALGGGHSLLLNGWMDGGGVGGGGGGGGNGGGGEGEGGPPTRRLAFHPALHLPDLHARVYFSEEINNVAASPPVIMIVVQSFYPGVCTLCSGVWPLKFAVWQKSKQFFSFPLIQSLCPLLLKQTH